MQGRIEEILHAVEQRERLATEERAQLDRRLGALEQTQGKIVDKVAPDLPDDKDQLWTQAASGCPPASATTAAASTASSSSASPQDPRAPQAYLAIGQSFVQESKFPNAAAEFQKVLDAYPKAPEVPEAMWHLSLAFLQLRFCTDAKSLLGDLVKRYPRSPRAAEAKNQLKNIAKLPKSSCTS